MLEQIVKAALSKVDPVQATKFIEKMNKSFEVQERIAKANEEIAAALRDLVEVKK